MRLDGQIATPWAPYAVAFSHDGTRLAIGGGTWYGFGGVVLVDLATQRSEVTSLAGEDRSNTVSGLAWSYDDRHLVASTWRSSQNAGSTLAFAVEGLTIEVVARRAPKSGLSPTSTGIVALGKRAIVRGHRAIPEDTLSIVGWPDEVDIDPRPSFEPLAGARLLIARDHAITGDHGVELPADRSSGLVVRSLSTGRVDFVGGPGARVTAIGCAGESTITTGHRDGTLLRWDWTGALPRPTAVLGTIPQPPIRVVGDLVWANYQPSSVIGICQAINGWSIAVTASGMLATWRPGTPLSTWEVPVLGSPRSIAAHPDRAMVAIGLKQGGFSRPQARVALVELLPQAIRDPWRTERTVAMARSAASSRGDSGGLDPVTLGVLADALEEVGCGTHVLEHLRAHDPRLSTCWVIDQLLA